MEQTEIIRILTAGFPSSIWYAPSLVLIILASVSFIDARTGRVPDAPVFIATFITLCSLAWFSGWFVAGERLLLVLTAVFLLRLFNTLYMRLCRHDAFGFGDAKWTGLAVAGFGIAPVFWAWVLAAWMGLLWMGGRRLVGALNQQYAGHAYIHFAPFLFVGLVVSLFKKNIADMFM